MLLCRITYESTREIKTYQIFESMRLYFFGITIRNIFEGVSWLADGLIKSAGFTYTTLTETGCTCDDLPG